jgi:hypothetical protein
LGKCLIGDPDSSPPAGAETVLFTVSSRPILGPTQTFFVRWESDLFPGLKKPESESDRLGMGIGTKMVEVSINQTTCFGPGNGPPSGLHNCD